MGADQSLLPFHLTLYPFPSWLIKQKQNELQEREMKTKVLIKDLMAARIFRDYFSEQCLPDETTNFISLVYLKKVTF